MVQIGWTSKYSIIGFTSTQCASKFLSLLATETSLLNIVSKESYLDIEFKEHGSKVWTVCVGGSQGVQIRKLQDVHLDLWRSFLDSPTSASTLRYL